MEIGERTVGDLTILDLNGRLIAGDGERPFLDVLDRLVTSGRRRILLNMAGVTYIDSCGVGAIVSKYLTLRRHDGELKLCNMQQRSFRVLDVTRLLTVFDWRQSEDEAVKSFTPTVK